MTKRRYIYTNHGKWRLIEPHLQTIVAALRFVHVGKAGVSMDDLVAALKAIEKAQENA